MDPNILRDLSNYCQQTGKWKELPYIQAFFYLFAKHSVSSFSSPSRALLAMKAEPEETPAGLDPADEPLPFRPQHPPTPSAPSPAPAFFSPAVGHSSCPILAPTCYLLSGRYVLPNYQSQPGYNPSYQGNSPHSLISGYTCLSCALPGKGSFSQSRSFYFFRSPICLTSDSPAAPLLLLLATHSTGSNVLLSLPASQCPQVWDTQNPSVARHHSPTVIQLQDRSRYIT